MRKKSLFMWLCICLVMTLLPTTVLAAGESAVQLKADGINDKDYLYYGIYDGSPIKWWVLDADEANNGKRGMFLLSKYLLENNVVFEAAYNSEDWDGQQFPNSWVDSDAQKWCKGFAEEPANGGAFSKNEKAAIMSTSFRDGPAQFDISFWDTGELKDDKVFFPSVWEVVTLVTDANGAPELVATDTDLNGGWWWLRSPSLRVPNYGSDSIVGACDDGGNVRQCIVNKSLMARPAFNLDLNSVLFTSAIAGGKSSGAEGASALKSILTTSTVTNWKPTLLDSSRNGFSVTTTAFSNTSASVNYSGAKTGANEYISAMIVDAGSVVYYGRIKKLPSAVDSSGTVTIKIPEGVTLDADTTLQVFNEQFNGDDNPNTTNVVEAKTDYSSNFRNVVPTEYTLTFETNGGSAISPITRTENTTVDLSGYMPTRIGYTFSGWYSDKSLTNAISSVKLTSNTVAYAKWTLNVPLNTKEHMAYVAGYPDGTVRPLANISRAETATMLYRLLTDSRRSEISTTLNNYSDVDSSLWYNQAVSTMTNGGYLYGYPDGTFGGDLTITRRICHYVGSLYWCR